MGILLTEEEMSQLSQKFPEGFTGRVGLMIAKAQARKIFEELESEFGEDIADGRTWRIRIRYEDWQALRKEAGL